MNELLDPIARTVGMPGWVLQTFLIILAALLLEFFYRLFVNRLERIAQRTLNLWDDAVVYAGKRPVSLLIWWQGVVLAARMVAPYTEVVTFDPVFLGLVQKLGLVIAATWFFFRLTSGFERAFFERKRKRNQTVDITTVQVIGRIVRIAVVLTGVLTGLSVLDIPISGFLAAGGVGGIAVGLAARDLLANFFGGLTVFMDRPFSVGDWVNSPDQNIEGVVEKIGWRMTTIRTFDRRPMYVPNAIFTTLTVINPSRMTYRRISETVGVRYDDFRVVKPIVDDVREMLRTHEDIASDQTLMVHFDEFSSSSIDFFIYCFTETTDWAEFHRVKEDVLLRIGEIIEGQGAEIAYPTRTLKVEAVEKLAGRGGATDD